MAVGKRARLTLDERRAQLVELGADVFRDRPYDEVSIDDIAAAAGVSKGLLYHYFDGKREFYVAALRHAAEEIEALTEPDEDLAPEAAPARGDRGLPRLRRAARRRVRVRAAGRQRRRPGRGRA